MPALKNDKFKDYTRYAEHCLNMVASTRDQELRCIQREMAAEWLRLADVVRRPRKSKCKWADAGRLTFGSLFLAVSSKLMRERASGGVRGIRCTVRARIERNEWTVSIHPAGIEGARRVVTGFAMLPELPDDVVGDGKALPHKISRSAVEDAIEAHGFQLWRIKKDSALETAP